MNTISYLAKPYIPKPSKSWLKNDEGCNKFYTYILKLENGDLYVGHTRDLKVRIYEHNEGVTRSTAGEHPKLKYFEILPTRNAAQIREYEIKYLLKHNRRELFKLITEFHELINKVDIT